MVTTKVKHLVNEVNSPSTENKSDENKPNDRPDARSDEGLTLDKSAFERFSWWANFFQQAFWVVSRTLWTLTYVTSRALEGLGNYLWRPSKCLWKHWSLSLMSLLIHVEYKCSVFEAHLCGCFRILTEVLTCCFQYGTSPVFGNWRTITPNGKHKSFKNSHELFSP